MEKWKLFDDQLVIKHDEAWGGIICVLSIFSENQCIKKFDYFRRDWFLLFDPTYDHMDFWLAHLPVDFERSVSITLQKQREDFIRTWTDNAQKNSGTGLLACVTLISVSVIGCIESLVAN